jgi:rubrerythrin
MIKENKDKEFICRRCSLFLDKEELNEGECPSCESDEHIFFNIS